MTMRFTKVCRPVDNVKEQEAHREHHERELVERAVLRAAEHDAAVDDRAHAHQEAAAAVRRRHWLQDWWVL